MSALDVLLIKGEYSKITVLGPEDLDRRGQDATSGAVPMASCFWCQSAPAIFP